MPKRIRRTSLRRMLGLALLCLFVFAALGPCLLLGLEADHDCTGEDCPVCRLLHTLPSLTVVCVGFCSGLVLSSFSLRRVVRRTAAQPSPVRLRTRLNS